MLAVGAPDVSTASSSRPSLRSTFTFIHPSEPAGVQRGLDLALERVGLAPWSATHSPICSCSVRTARNLWKVDKLEGKPCVRGLRITVETVVRLVAAGWSFDQILEEYPDLEQADIQQALEYAAAATDVHVHRLRSPA